MAGALVALMAGVSLGPALHDGAGHDTDCDPIVVVHDAAQHQFSAAPAGTPSPADNHCVACHFHRTPRGAVSWELSGLRPLEAVRVLRSADGEIAPAPPLAALPARAPPALA